MGAGSEALALPRRAKATTWWRKFSSSQWRSATDSTSAGDALRISLRVSSLAHSREGCGRAGGLCRAGATAASWGGLGRAADAPQHVESRLQGLGAGQCENCRWLAWPMHRPGWEVVITGKELVRMPQAKNGDLAYAQI